MENVISIKREVSNFKFKKMLLQYMQANFKSTKLAKDFENWKV